MADALYPQIVVGRDCRKVRFPCTVNWGEDEHRGEVEQNECFFLSACRIVNL